MKVGWLFTAAGPSGVPVSWAPIGGTLSMEIGRDVTRTITDLTIDPDAADNLDLSGIKVNLTMRIDNGQTTTDYQMGVFSIGPYTVQEDVLLDRLGQPADLAFAALMDPWLALRTSSAAPYVLPAGGDPADAMRATFDAVGLQRAIAAAVSPTGEEVAWQPFTAYASRVNDLARFAGHRAPWCDRYGVARSVPALVTYADEVLPLEDLGPRRGTVATTRDPTAPNRVVAHDTSSSQFEGIVGEWVTPASADNSQARTGRDFTIGLAQQGLSGRAHAESVAQAAGVQGTARKLSFTCDPTHLLDGPVLLGHKGRVYAVASWTVPLTGDPGMAVTAVEVTGIAPEGAQ